MIAPHETDSLIERTRSAFSFRGASGAPWWRVVLTYKTSDALEGDARSLREALGRLLRKHCSAITDPTFACTDPLHVECRTLLSPLEGTVDRRSRDEPVISEE